MWRLGHEAWCWRALSMHASVIMYLNNIAVFSPKCYRIAVGYTFFEKKFMLLKYDNFLTRAFAKKSFSRVEKSVPYRNSVALSLK